MSSSTISSATWLDSDIFQYFQYLWHHLWNCQMCNLTLFVYSFFYNHIRSFCFNMYSLSREVPQDLAIFIFYHNLCCVYITFSFYFEATQSADIFFLRSPASVYTPFVLAYTTHTKSNWYSHLLSCRFYNYCLGFVDLYLYLIYPNILFLSGYN